MTEEKIHDIAIIGCGPAGLSAAVNASIRNTDLIVLGAKTYSPKLHKAPEVNNYLGIFDVSGKELMQKYLDHAEKMGITVNKAKIDNIYYDGNHYTLISSEQSYKAYALILALGVSNTKYLPGEEDFIGKGVSYCATCDGPLFKGKKVAVIAYSKEGIEEAEYLADIADSVYLLPQFDYQDNPKNNINIINEKPEKIIGDNLVESIKLDNSKLDVDGIFIIREVTPPDKLLMNLKLNDNHIAVNNNMETNLPGVYAAGDCTGTPYQISRATGQGQTAGLNAASFARKKKESKRG